MARHQRDLKREQTWRRHIERQRSSGLTVRDYCLDQAGSAANDGCPGEVADTTVPKGTERLRFTPSPNHTDAMMDDLVTAMDKLWTHCNVARLPAVA